jgi:hypothetical protein
MPCWDGARVAAISTIGFQDGSRQSKLAQQGSAAFPGMRDTQFTNHKVPGGPTRTSRRYPSGTTSSGCHGSVKGALT